MKCGQERPICTRCQRLCLTCQGYRTIDDLVFLDETSKVSTKHYATLRDQRRQMTKSTAIFLDSTGRDGIVWCFYHVTMETMTPMDHPYHSHATLPGMYHGCARDSALVLATRALSYATGCRMMKLETTAARASYITAVEALQHALQDPSKANDDETLYRCAPALRLRDHIL